MRRYVKNLLIAAAPTLAAAGIIVVTTGQNPPNIDLDCVMAQGDGKGFCVAILEPPLGQCAALHSRSDPGGVPGRILRALQQLEERRAISDWMALPIPSDGGVTGCYVEVRLTVERRTLQDGRRVLDGQAPAWRDVVNASDLSSIVKAGHVSRRPAYARRGACRAHVWLGEEPCATSEEIADGGYIEDPDGGG